MANWETTTSGELRLKFVIYVDGARTVFTEGMGVKDTGEHRATLDWKKKAIELAVANIHAPSSKNNANGYEDLLTLCPRNVQRFRGLGVKTNEGDQVALSMHGLFDLVLKDYQKRGLSNAKHLESTMKPLLAYPPFKNLLASKFTSVMAENYIYERQKAGYSKSTINAELSIIIRGYTIAVKELGILSKKPFIKKFGKKDLNNIRKGFFEREQLDAFKQHMPEYTHRALEADYILGWRFTELFTRKVRHVDLGREGSICLEPGETKNREGRVFPLRMRPEGAPRGLREIIEEQIAETRQLEKRTGRIIPWLFHRNGEQIKGFRKSWAYACRMVNLPIQYKVRGPFVNQAFDDLDQALKAAGIKPGSEVAEEIAEALEVDRMVTQGEFKFRILDRLFHDFRRTAVRNLELAGIPREAAKKVTGHLTNEVYERYAIVDKKTMDAAVDRYETFLGGQEHTNMAQGTAVEQKKVRK